MEYCGGGSVADLIQIMECGLNEDEIAIICREALQVFNIFVYCCLFLFDLIPPSFSSLPFLLFFLICVSRDCIIYIHTTRYIVTSKEETLCSTLKARLNWVYLFSFPFFDLYLYPSLPLSLFFNRN